VGDLDRGERPKNLRCLLAIQFIQIFRYRGFPLRRLEEIDGEHADYVALK
jgi:hypothetical protein